MLDYTRLLAARYQTDILFFPPATKVFGLDTYIYPSLALANWAHYALNSAIDTK